MSDFQAIFKSYVSFVKLNNEKIDMPDSIRCKSKLCALGGRCKFRREYLSNYCKQHKENIPFGDWSIPTEADIIPIIKCMENQSNLIIQSRDETYYTTFGKVKEIPEYKSNYTPELPDIKEKLNLVKKYINLSLFENDFVEIMTKKIKEDIIKRRYLLSRAFDEIHSVFLLLDYVSTTGIIISDKEYFNTFCQVFKMLQIERNDINNYVKLITAGFRENKLYERFGKALDKYSKKNKKTFINSLGECAICLEKLKEESVVSLTTCSHSYCKSCINEWSKRKDASCPLCRIKLIQNGFKKVEFTKIKYNNDLFKMLMDCMTCYDELGFTGEIMEEEIEEDEEEDEIVYTEECIIDGIEYQKDEYNNIYNDEGEDIGNYDFINKKWIRR